MSEYDCLPSVSRSPRAFARFRELVQQANADPIRVREDITLTDAVMNWWEITMLESYVFGIDPSLVNALRISHCRYLDMIGETHGDFAEFQAEDRAAFPELVPPDGIYSVNLAAGFMANACGVPFTQTLMWACRTQAQLIHSDLIIGPSEAPEWMRCEVEASEDQAAF